MFSASVVQAVLVSIDGVSGSYRKNSSTFGWFDQRYMTGERNTYIHRSYFVFDLSGLSGDVQSAKLLLTCPPEGYDGDEFEIFATYDVSTDLSLLMSGGAGQSGWEDLGSGTTYGSVAMSENDENTLVEIALNMAAVSDIQSSLGNLFAIGGSLETIDNPNKSLERVFANTAIGDDPGGSLIRRLVLDINMPPRPVPDGASTVMIMGLAIGSLAVLRRRLG